MNRLLVPSTGFLLRGAIGTPPGRTRTMDKILSFESTSSPSSLAYRSAGCTITTAVHTAIALATDKNARSQYEDRQ